jgi:hypothetical protein
MQEAGEDFNEQLGERYLAERALRDESNDHADDHADQSGKQNQKGTESSCYTKETEKAEEEEEEEEEEEGWIDVFEDDDYVGIYGSLFDFCKSPRTAAIFGPLEVLRMLIVGVCIAHKNATFQANAIMGIHALQFALQIIIPPEPGAWDRFMDTLAMATDLIPLIISVLPVELFSADGCGGALPVGAQMLVMGAALLATGQRILVLFFDLIPQLFELLQTCASIVYKLFCICALIVFNAKKPPQRKTEKTEPSFGVGGGAVDGVGGKQQGEPTGGTGQQQQQQQQGDSGIEEEGIESFVAGLL